MTQKEMDCVLKAHWSLPEGCRNEPAKEGQVQNFETSFGPIPRDYRWYLLNCGGGVIGSDWIDGISELAETHRKVRDEHTALQDFFAIGWDGCGNPYGFDVATGGIVSEDHQFGGFHKVAGDFYGLLRAKGLVEDV